MNIGDVMIVASIIAGLVAIPFTASRIFNEYKPIGTSVIEMEDVSDIPGKLTKHLSSEKFEQRFQTPFGELIVRVKSSEMYQELLRPDMRVIVSETPGTTEWKLITKEYTLNIIRMDSEIRETFRSPSGYLEKVKVMGNVSESIMGDTERVKNEYQEATELLYEKIEEIERLTREYMSLPGSSTVKITYVNCTGDWVEITNEGDITVSLIGWKLNDTMGSTSSYSFPDGFRLRPNGKVRVFRESGTDTETEIYNSGITLNNDPDESVILINQYGKIVSKRYCDEY